MACTCPRPDTAVNGGVSFCLGCGEVVASPPHLDANGILASFRESDDDDFDGIQDDDNLDLNGETYQEPPPMLPKDLENDGFEGIEDDDDLDLSGEAYYEPPTVLLKDTYSRLNPTKREVRLVVLQPGGVDDPIQCRIIHSELTRWLPPRYEAVSYTWADQEGDNSFSAVAHTNFGDIPITLNAKAVLQRIRLPDQQRTIWMDQLCINQGDTSERSQQVGLMPEIYSSATQVLICLVDVSLQLIHVGASRIVFDCLWFYRVWVLQEVANARKALVIGCDTEVMEWELFRTILSKWHARSSSLQVSAPPLPGALKLELCRRVHPDELLDLLRNSRGCSAGDPRDKIFALFGILIQQPTSPYAADYSKSAETVYMETAHDIIRCSRALDILSSCATTRTKIPTLRLPSWVPDWTLPPQEELREVLRKSYGVLVNPLPFGNRHTSIRPSTKLRELRVLGRQVDKVTMTTRDGLSFATPRTDLMVEMYGHCNLDQFEAQVEPHGWSKDHFFGTKFSVGFSFQQPKIGDEIWQLEGAEVLFFLRSVGNKKSVVGECYLWGMTYHMCCNTEQREPGEGSYFSGCFCNVFLEIGQAPPVEIILV